jgi:hypothetical protein
MTRLIALFSATLLLASCSLWPAAEEKKDGDYAQLWQNAYDRTENSDLKATLDNNRDTLVSNGFDVTALNEEESKQVTQVLTLIARNTQDPAMIEILMSNSAGNIQLWLAKNPALPNKYYERFLTSDDTDQRAYLAANPSLTEKEFGVLKNDAEASVRWVVARNKNTPIDILEEFVNDSSYHVTVMLARNESITEEIMSLLVAQAHPSVMAALRKREDLPAAISEQVEAFFAVDTEPTDE